MTLPEIETQIPLFRAKKVGYDEYVIGFLYQVPSGMINGEPSYLIGYGKKIYAGDYGAGATYKKLDYKIDISTLAIHHPEMIDSTGAKIFASLSKSRKGGDKAKFGYIFVFDSQETIPYFDNYNNYTVTGIQE